MESLSRSNVQSRTSSRLNYQLNLQISPSVTTNATVFAAWTPWRAMERGHNACYEEREETERLWRGSNLDRTHPRMWSGGVLCMSSS